MKSAQTTKQRSMTDWKRIDGMGDEDIDLSDIPEQSPDFFANAILWPGPKRQITLRLDPDVLKFFRKQGRAGIRLPSMRCCESTWKRKKGERQG
jgi:uncharacterized protein (DUF4415 family)